LRSTVNVNATGWSRGLEVTGGNTGVVSHAGLVLLRQVADRTGLTAGLSAALPSPLGGHNRGRVLSDLACAIADGARVISDFRVMGNQRELFRSAASVPTAWRAAKEAAAGGDRTPCGSPTCPPQPRAGGAGGPTSTPSTASTPGSKTLSALREPRPRALPVAQL
jgi:hypothetical protein